MGFQRQHVVLYVYVCIDLSRKLNPGHIQYDLVAKDERKYFKETLVANELIAEN